MYFASLQNLVKSSEVLLHMRPVYSSIHYADIMCVSPVYVGMSASEALTSGRCCISFQKYAEQPAQNVCSQRKLRSHYQWDSDNVSATVTKLWVGRTRNRGLIICRRMILFYDLNAPDLIFGPQSFLFSVYWGRFPLGLKQLRRASDHTPSLVQKLTL
jgi:hypothetical protein